MKAKVSHTPLSKSWKLCKTHSATYTGGPFGLKPDRGLYLGLCGKDVSIADLKTGELLGLLQSKLPVRDCARSVSLLSPYICYQVPQQEEITAFAVRPGHNEVVTASRNFLLRHWNLDTKECIRAIKGPRMPITTMCFEHTGTLVAFGVSDGTVQVCVHLLHYEFRGFLMQQRRFMTSRKVTAPTTSVAILAS